MSAYHDVKTLLEQEMKGYDKGEQDYKNGDGVPFLSRYKTLGDFYKALNFSPPPYSLVQVCYGGIFAARSKNVLQQDMTLWRTLRKTLVSSQNQNYYSRHASFGYSNFRISTISVNYVSSSCRSEATIFKRVTLQSEVGVLYLPHHCKRFR